MSLRMRLLVGFLGLFWAILPTSLAQSPSSVAGRTAEMKITAGNGPFASSGSSRLLISATDNSYGLVSTSGEVSSSYGTFSYSKTGTNSAVANFNDSEVGSGLKVTLSFSNPNEGTFETTLSSAPGSYQRGSFRLYAGPSPTTIKGMTFDIKVDAGVYPYASYGSYTLKTDPTLNTYQIPGGYGVSTSSGTYAYTPLDSGKSTIVFKDSQSGTSMSQTLSWDTPTSGAYVVRDAAQVGYQAGTFKVTAQIQLPSITQHPVSVTLNAGAITVLKVVASSVEPLTYQWRKNGVSIAGATASSLTLSGVGESSAGTYDVVVSGLSGSVTSAGAEVRVVFPAKILTPPESSAAQLGESVTLSVSVSGTPPFTFKWKKNGVLISSATTDTLILPSVKSSDFGSYTVEVSNSAGSAASAPVDVTLGEKVVITTQPSSVSTRLEAAATFVVTAAGTEPLSYQWKKDGTPIPGATRPSLTISRTTANETGSYEVFVYNAFGNATSISAQLSIAGDKGISLLSNPGPPATGSLTVVKGSTGTVSVSVDAVDPSLARTTYRLLRVPPEGLPQPLAPVTLVPANGIIHLPLRTITESGTYAIEYVRQYADGSPEVRILSETFAVEAIPMETAAGVYELLLEDSNRAIPDGATYRGALVVTVTKSGTVSGRLFYNEAPELYNTADPSLRVYKPVTRSFSGAFAASQSSTEKLVCTPKLGVGAQAGRQELSLELDFTTSPISLSAAVTDHVSASSDSGPEDLLCVASPVSRNLTKLAGTLDGQPAELSTAIGRYNLGSLLQTGNDPCPGMNLHALIFAQVLSSGRILWVSRFTGQSGSGSAGLRPEEGGALVASFYEGRLISTSKLHQSNSLLSTLQLNTTGSGEWLLHTRVGFEQGHVERQTSYITKTNDRPEYSEWLEPASQGTKTANWTGIALLDLTADGSGMWNGTTKAGLFRHFSLTPPASTETAPRICRLTLEDPIDHATYSWSVSLSSTGAVRTLAEAAGQPVLVLRFDKSRGEFSGSYLPTSPEDKLRRTLSGAALLDWSEELTRAQGWVELNALPATSTAPWRLELISP